MRVSLWDLMAFLFCHGTVSRGVFILRVVHSTHRIGGNMLKATIVVGVIWALVSSINGFKSNYAKEIIKHNEMLEKAANP